MWPILGIYVYALDAETGARLWQRTVAPQRRHTVRVHFADLGDAKVGRRVFDVRLQGEPVLKNFDVVREAGGTNRAIVREFKGVRASENLKLELMSNAEELTPTSTPIISAIEIAEERGK